MQKKLDQRESKQLVVRFFDKPVKLREQSEKLIKFVLWSKDVVAAAMKSEPHAAIAWAGASLILSVRCRQMTRDWLDKYLFRVCSYS